MTAHMPTPSEIRSCLWNYPHWDDRWCHDVNELTKEMSMEERMREDEDYSMGGKAYPSEEEEDLCWSERSVDIEMEGWLGMSLEEAMVIKSFKKKVTANSVTCDWGVMKELHCVLPHLVHL